MMDLSDGLAKDLPRLADQSGGFGYQIDFESIPINDDADLAAAVGEGEAYELLFTAPSPEILPKWKSTFPDLPLTHIGQMAALNHERTPLDGGWDHFD